MPQGEERDMEAIVSWLKGVQKAENLSHEEMAAHLRITRSGWGHLRLGRRGLTLHTVYWAARAFRAQAVPPLLFHLLGLGHDSLHKVDDNASLSA